MVAMTPATKAWREVPPVLAARWPGCRTADGPVCVRVCVSVSVSV